MLRLAAATALVLAFAAAPAAAATVTELKPCYVSAGPLDAERETITISGTDFTQLSVVEVLFDGVVMGSAQTGSVGEFTIRLPAPFVQAGERPLTVTVRDAANAVAKTTNVTNLAMTVKPRRVANPRRRVRFRGRGFTLPGPVFAHYLYGDKERRTVRLARQSTAPCGTFTVKRRLVPIDGARPGRWTVQVDQHREYSPTPDPVWVRRPIDIVEIGNLAQGARFLAGIRLEGETRGRTGTREP
jgi:IPT/TIG domain